MRAHRKNHILFEVVFECLETENLEEFSVAMGFPNEWTSNVCTPNKHCVDIHSTDLTVVKKFCKLVANGVISDNGAVCGWDEHLIKALILPTEKE